MQIPLLSPSSSQQYSQMYLQVCESWEMDHQKPKVRFRHLSRKRILQTKAVIEILNHFCHSSPFQPICLQTGKSDDFD